MKKVLLLVVSIFLFAGAAWGTTLDIDVTGSSCEIQSSDTIRVRQMSVTGYGTYYVYFKWNNTTYNFAPTNASTDTLSVVGAWIFTMDCNCDSGTDAVYLTLNSDHTIKCTTTSAYSTSCMNYSSGGTSGTWSLSGSILTLYFTTINSSQVINGSKLTGTLNGTQSYNGIQDGKMYSKNSSTLEYTTLNGCWSATRSTN